MINKPVNTYKLFILAAITVLKLLFRLPFSQHRLQEIEYSAETKFIVLNQLGGDDDKSFHIEYGRLALQRIMSWAARAADLWTRPVGKTAHLCKQGLVQGYRGAYGFELYIRVVRI